MGPPMEAPKILRISLGGVLQSFGLGSVQVLQLCQFVEVIVRAGIGVAKVLVDRAVNVIGAAFGHQSHLGAAGSSLVCVGIGSSDAKLLYGIERHGQNGCKSVAAFVVHANAIEN